MKKLLFLLALSVVACNEPDRFPGPTPMVYHDDQRKVTCWELSDNSGVSISCLPDKSFNNVQLPQK